MKTLLAMFITLIALMFFCMSLQVAPFAEGVQIGSSHKVLLGIAILLILIAAAINWKK